MKKSNIALLLMSLLLIGFSNCKKETEPPTERFSINKEKEKVLPMTTSVTITGEYTFSGKVKSMKLKLGTNENLFGSDEYAAELANNSYSVTISGLSPGTLYYYRYLVDYGDDIDFESEIYDFTTLSEVPIVKALEVVAIDSTTFRIKCEVLSDGGSEVTERGICWNNFGDPGMDDDTLRYSTGGIGQYNIRMEDLVLGKKYYVRAYAKSSAGIGLSEEVLNFETVAPSGVSVDIELSCNPEEGGTVTGGGAFEVGTQCTVTAIANTGYTFVNWTENGVQVSSDAQYAFTVTTSRNLVANFTMQDYIITAEVDPEDSGTVTGAGGYNYGEQCTLTATAMTGYDFVKWTKGNTTVSTDAEYSFTVTATATYVAHFSIKSYSVNVSANPTNGGTVSGGGTFNYGESRTVHATPANGFAFSNWTDDGDEVSTDADYTFTVSSNRNLVANFTVLQPDEYSITVSANPSEGGTVTGGGTYQQGQSCTVKATSKPNFTFVNWTENGNQVSDLAEYPFTVTGNRILVANFEAQAPTEYTVSVSANPSNGGTVTGGGTYEQGQQCTVTATANDGYNFTNWTEGGNVVSTQASYTFTVNSDRNLVANFLQQSYTINASANPSNGGTVSGAGIYNYGQSCPLSATAASGYTFTNWTENGNVVSTNANYTFTVTGNRTLVANFTVQAPNTYNINVSANPPEGGTVTGGGSYTQGEQCTVSATENNGYTFLRWTENGNQVSTQASYTFTVTGNRTLVAQFQVQSYTISVSANPTNGGTVTGGGTYNYGQSCEVTAMPAYGYNFIRWTENGNQVSTNPSYTFQVTGPRNLVAQFQLKSYTINVSANPSNGGTVTGSGTYNHGQQCNVTATPNSGYTFVRWTENGSQVSTNPSYTFTVTGNRTLVAQFQQQTYTITATANPTNGGTISGNQSPYTYGQTCNLTATPASNYTFTNWTENGSVVSTQASYQFSVTSNRTLVANFTYVPPTYTITVSANPSNGGTVTGGGTYNQGASCTVTATPNSNYSFTNWTENGNVVSTQANYTFTVTSNRTLVANFTYNPPTPTYTITVSANPSNGGTVTGGGTYNQGQQCMVTATPNSNYTFTNWTENGNEVSTNANYTFTVTSNRTLVAQFQQQSYTINVSVNPSNGGSVSGGGNYNYGQSCTVNATAAMGYTFLRWTENGNQVSTNANYTFTVTGNRTLVANFTAPPQGAINGLFTINANGDQVYFSQGNLQYNKTTQVWSFMEHQYDIVETLGQVVGENYANQNIISLFGWGTSGYNHGANCYQPWSTSTSNSDYYAYGNSSYNLYDGNGQADWGYNLISNGGNTTNLWRTLSRLEWTYVFNTRTTISGIRYAKAEVNNVNGVILLPDNWSSSYFTLNGTNNSSSEFSNNVISSSTWISIFETHGAVFLPAAGARTGFVGDVGSSGYYWSASRYNNSTVYYVTFNSSQLFPQFNNDRYWGVSVRLVYPCL